MSKAYISPDVFVDSVVFQLIDERLFVLLIKRSKEPFKDMWALPGGYNPAGETTLEAMTRTLDVKGGLDRDDLGFIEQLYTFDTVARDPRGHGISVTYMGIGKDLVPEGSKTTEHPQFFAVGDLPDLAFDHRDIVKYAHDRLKAKLSYTNAVFGLMPKLFTLSQLQTAYEAVYGHKLDKRNFRKKFLSLGLIKETTESFRDGAHRPARLYRFNKKGLETLERAFD